MGRIALADVRDSARRERAKVLWTDGDGRSVGGGGKRRSAVPPARKRMIDGESTGGNGPSQQLW